MVRSQCLLQSLFQDVCVDLRRGDVSVAQHLLYRAEIGAVCEKVGRESMAQHMRRNAPRINARFDCKIIEQLGKALTRQMTASAARRKKPRRFFIVRQERLTDVKVGL